SGNRGLRRLRDNFEGSWIAWRGLCERSTGRHQKKKEKSATRRSKLHRANIIGAPSCSPRSPVIPPPPPPRSGISLRRPAPSSGPYPTSFYSLKEARRAPDWAWGSRSKGTIHHESTGSSYVAGWLSPFARMRRFAAQALVFHPTVEDAFLEFPSVTEFERRNQLLRDILVERVRRNSQVVRCLTDVHHFARIGHVGSFPAC